METTEQNVMEWFSSAKPGETLIYKEGCQLVQRGGRRGSLSVSSGVIAVRRLYDLGMIDLFQRRTTAPGYKLNDSSFEYIAMRRAETAKIDPGDTFAKMGGTSPELVA